MVLMAGFWVSRTSIRSGSLKGANPRAACIIVIGPVLQFRFNGSSKPPSAAAISTIHITNVASTTIPSHPMLTSILHSVMHNSRFCCSPQIRFFFAVKVCNMILFPEDGLWNLGNRNWNGFVPLEHKDPRLWSGRHRGPSSVVCQAKITI